MDAKARQSRVSRNPPVQAASPPSTEGKESTDAWDLTRKKAKNCTACPLYKTGTQTIFGEGPVSAKVMMIGEQPGDREDLEGHPFVGPAGQLLDKVLMEAGIDRREVYVTNAVKHFKWVPAGNRRLHKKPSAREIAACKPWLEKELDLVKPEVVVALGATAAQALMGPAFRVTLSHGKAITVPWAKAFVATVHPSSILRAPPETRAEQRAQFLADLKVVAKLLRSGVF